MTQYRCTVHDAVYEGDRPDHDGSSDDCPGCIRDAKAKHAEFLATLEKPEPKTFPLGSEKEKNPDGSTITPTT